jgi:hypothetical protein
VNIKFFFDFKIIISFFKNERINVRAHDKKEHKETTKVQFLKNERQKNLLSNDTQSEIKTMKKITNRNFIISNSSKLIQIN